MIFQEPMTALNPVIKVGDQIGEMLEIHTGASGADRKKRVLDAMEGVKLPNPRKMYDAYPHQLSGGQRQRMMIAMALALEPRLLIADEPTTALDVTTQAQILRLIKSIQAERGTAVMFITHDFGVVAEIADRVVVMKEGRVVESGAGDESMLKAPEHPYTRDADRLGAVADARPIGRRSRRERWRCRRAGSTWPMAAQGLFGRGRVVHAAQDVELTLRRGETLGVVGESGSGKSTVARCIVRLIDPTGGEVRIDGTEHREAQARRAARRTAATSRSCSRTPIAR